MPHQLEAGADYVEGGHIENTREAPIKFGEPPKPRREELAVHLYHHPHSPKEMTALQRLTATRRQNEGAPEGDLPPEGDVRPW